MSENSTPETVTLGEASGRLFRDAPRWNGLRTLAVGQFRSPSEAAGSALLCSVADRAAVEGFEAVIGPMDGDTWHAYRLVTESDGSAAFPLEPVSGATDAMAFAAAGFAPISRYVSARAQLPELDALQAPDVSEGIEVVAWDGRDAEALIGGIFDMSLSAFARNAFYKPITRAAFLDLYRPLLPMLDHRFILFAHAPGGEIVGFLFAYPNPMAAAAAPEIVIKTYASARRGVGRMLVASLNLRARRAGFTHAVHALMHVDNVSRERSVREGGEIFRRYALMGRRLVGNDGA
ncbi:MAG: hypothetical protein AB7E70_19950 [Hyphomicrobiaceae bacterium]